MLWTGRARFGASSFRVEHFSNPRTRGNLRTTSQLCCVQISPLIESDMLKINCYGVLLSMSLDRELCDGLVAFGTDPSQQAYNL